MHACTRTNCHRYEHALHTITTEGTTVHAGPHTSGCANCRQAGGSAVRIRLRNRRLSPRLAHPTRLGPCGPCQPQGHAHPKFPNAPPAGKRHPRLRRAQVSRRRPWGQTSSRRQPCSTALSCAAGSQPLQWASQLRNVATAGSTGASTSGGVS